MLASLFRKCKAELGACAAKSAKPYRSSFSQRELSQPAGVFAASAVYVKSGDKGAVQLLALHTFCQRVSSSHEAALLCTVHSCWRTLKSGLQRERKTPHCQSTRCLFASCCCGHHSSRPYALTTFQLSITQ